MLGHQCTEKPLCKGNKEDGQREIEVSHTADPVRKKGRERHREAESTPAR